MKKLIYTFFLTAALLSSLPAQERDDPDQVPLSSTVAETMLIHKEEPACQKNSDGVRVKGTVVIAITIDKNGRVSHPHTVSGPKMLRPLAAATVLKYRYKPYLLNGTPIEVETVVSIPIDCFFHTGQA
jgi:protein TonB